MSHSHQPEASGRIVRPYTMTGGRTVTDSPPIALEALVSVTPAGMRMRRRFRWEAAEIIEMSRRETAIIELAALLEVPIGVVRVLADDLRTEGAVKITDPPPVPGPETAGPEYADLLNKVLDGIKSL
jgi:hypothetical protein